MRWPWSDYELLREQLVKAEVRAETAEAALTAEREARMRDVRHLLSSWLRHEKSHPLPPTAGEKDEAQEARVKQGPPPLSELQEAMREANRRDAAQYGYSEAEADEIFMKNLGQMPTE